MTRAALLCALVGCVTTSGIVKGDQTTMPILIGGTAGDLVVTGVVAAEAEGLSTAASIATALAITALDVGVGCLLGACAPLKL